MTPLQIAAAAGHLAGAACDMLLDWIAPLDTPPIPDEPPLENHELIAVRQLIEERWPLTDPIAVRNNQFILNALSMAEPMPTWVGNDNGLQDSPAAGTAAGGAAPADPPKAGAAHSKVTSDVRVSAAIGLREFAELDACETPTFWRHIASQLDPEGDS